MTKKNRNSAAASMRNIKQQYLDQTGRLDIGDGISLFLHAKSRCIWADHRLPDGRRKRMSTKVRDDVSLAEQVAKRQNKELRRKLASGTPISVSGPTVGDLLTAYKKVLEAELAAGNHSLKPELSVLRKNLIPFWEQVPLAELNRQTFYAWTNWRVGMKPGQPEIRAYDRGGRSVTNVCLTKAPSRTTLAREKTHFVGALDWGCNQLKPWISDEVAHEIRHAPYGKKQSVKLANAAERRDSLTDDQQNSLLAEFAHREAAEKARAANGGEKGKRKNYSRRLMACHARLLLTSGLRPGAEISELVWSNIKHAHLQSGEEIIVIDPCGNGKTGPRLVNCTPAAVQVIKDLRGLLEEFGQATHGQATLWPNRKGGVVKDFGGSFKTTMKKLKFPLTVSDEPLYILRHTYITDRLRAGVSSDIIATNAGTSVEMIEKHYKHVKAEQIRDQLHPADTSSALKLRLSPQMDSVPLRISNVPGDANPIRFP